MKIVDTGEDDTRLLSVLIPRRCCCSVGQRVAYQVSYHVEMVEKMAVTGGINTM